MSHRHSAKRDEGLSKGPSHERHKRRRARKCERERALRDAWVTEVWGEAGHGSCGRKRRFRCRHEATQFVDGHHIARPIWAYRCPYCSGWHLTHHPKDGGLPL